MKNGPRLFPQILGVGLVLVLSVLVMGCPNAESCYTEFAACTAECDEAWAAANAEVQSCLDGCGSAQNQAAETNCAALADDQLAYVNCISGSLNAEIQCQAGCMEALGGAFKAHEACTSQCGEGFLSCL